MKSLIVGVDFGAPRRARDQRRKIVAMAAYETAPRSYRIDTTGMNSRLLASESPGWSAQELLEELLSRPARIVGFDFPFCVPDDLLRDEWFASSVGHTGGAFLGWRAFSEFVAAQLPIIDPLDFKPFAAWRDPTRRARLWTKRATDVAARGQPPLKDKFQATFQMTLLGNALLSKLWESQMYRVLPFAGGRGDGEILEVYPAATLRAMGLAGYKSRPAEAIGVSLGACSNAGIDVEIDPRLTALACRYRTGTADYDVADALVALCTAIFHAEGACRPALAPAPNRRQRLLDEREGAIWVPTLKNDRSAREG